MSTDTVPHAYSAEDLAWFAREYADTEWMVHVVGPDDCHLHANPDLEDDDPANPLLTEGTAWALADSIRRFNTWYHAKYPRESAPGLIPTVFHFGVPAGPEPQPQIEGQTELALAGTEAAR